MDTPKSGQPPYNGHTVFHLPISYISTSNNIKIPRFHCSYLEGGCRGREGKQGEMGRLPPRGEAEETGRVLYGRPVSDTCTLGREEMKEGK